MISSSLPRKQSPPPPVKVSQPPPPMPPVFPANLQALEAPRRDAGPSVKLIKSFSTDVTTPSIMACSSYRSGASRQHSKHSAPCDTGDPTAVDIMPSQPALESSTSSHLHEARSQTSTVVVRTPVIEKPEHQAPKARLEPRCSGYVRWTRPHPSRPGREFIYVCQSQYDAQNERQLGRFLGELDERVARHPLADITRRVPDGWVVSNKGRVHRRLSSLGDFKRTASVKTEKRRSLSVGGKDAGLIGEDRANFRKRRGTVSMPGGAAVVYEQPAKKRNSKRLKHGRITNSGTMRVYAERAGNTSAICVNDIEESRRSRSVTVRSDISMFTSGNARDSKFTEHLASGALQRPLVGPPPRISTPKAGSLHFDPKSFQIKDDSPNSKQSFRRGESSPTRMSMHRPRSQPFGHGKTPSFSSVIALATTNLRARSRSPVKKSSPSKECIEEPRHSREPFHSQNKFRRFINFYGKLHQTTASTTTSNDIDEFLGSKGSDDKAPVASSGRDTASRDSEIAEVAEKASGEVNPSHAHSKSISAASTLSIAKSDEVAAIINDAKAVTLSRPGTPKRRSNASKHHPESPGPAPSAPLPPVPECSPQIAHSTLEELPVTPKARTPRSVSSSQAERRSPTKSKTSPDKGDKFSLYPSPSPPKRSSSPPKLPAVTVRIRAESFPKPPSFGPSPEKKPLTKASLGEGVPDHSTSEDGSPNDDYMGSSVLDCQEYGEAMAQEASMHEDFAEAAPIGQSIDFSDRQRPVMPRRARSSLDKDRYYRRDSHVTEEILSWYSDRKPRLEDPFISNTLRQPARSSVCSISPIIVNSEQVPIRTSFRDSADMSAQKDGVLEHPASAKTRTGDVQDSAYFSNGARPAGPLYTSSESSGASMAHESRTLFEKDVFLAHENLLKAINRSSMHSSQPSSQRSSMMDYKIEARLSRVEKALVAVLDAQREASMKVNLDVSSADDEDFTQSGRKNRATVVPDLDEEQGQDHHHDSQL